MRQKIVAGNWKMNTTLAEGIELVNQIVGKIEEVPQDVKLIVNTPFTHLFPVSKIIGDIKCPFCRSKISLGAQNCADKEKGAYTGEVSAKMLASVSKAVGTVAGAPEGATGAPVEYVILGHSERRDIFGENDILINAKVKKAFASGLKPILCCGESLALRKAGTYKEWIERQIKWDLTDVTADQVKELVIAYEPIWAIGTGETATADQAQEVCKLIRDLIAKMYDAATAEAVRIQYGGSMNAGNAAELLAKPDIDGGLIGGASLKPDFGKIVNA